IHLPLAILVAAAAGGILAFVPGLLKAKLGVHEVIITIMFNYIALFSANSIIRNVLTEGADKTEKIFPSASLSCEWLAAFTDYSRVNYGIFIALIAAIIMWFIMDYTIIGYEMIDVGNSYVGY